jgi:hypothetical protein
MQDHALILLVTELNTFHFMAISHEENPDKQ